MSQQGNYQTAPTIRDFVLQQAQERSFEISIKALKEYQLAKNNILKQKNKLLLQQVFFHHQFQIECRIKKSLRINQSRLDKMNARNKAIMKIFSQVQNRIKNIINNKERYKKLLKVLIIQGLIKLFQPKIMIRCLQRDYQIVNQVISQCQNQFQKIVKQELKRTFKIQININKQHFLKERQIQDNSCIPVQDYDLKKNQLIGKAENDLKCFGGLLLTNEDGLIVCKNTLDVRIQQCFNQSLPEIRSMLFPIQKA